MNMTDRGEGKMTKLYYEALSKIPKRFIDKETVCATFNGNTKAVIIANPKFCPMMYRFKNRRWKSLKLSGR